jgi:hypothetical protein
VRILAAIKHNRRVTRLLESGDIIAGIREIVTWRTNEIEKATPCNFSKDDIEVLSQAMLYCLEKYFNEDKFANNRKSYVQNLIRFFDSTTQDWTALWSMRLATLSILDTGAEQQFVTPELKKMSRLLDEKLISDDIAKINKQLIDADFPQEYL